MPLVKQREGEGFEILLKRFKKSCEKAGILSDVKKKEHFEKPSVRLKKKSIAARKRLIKKQKKSYDNKRDTKPGMGGGRGGDRGDKEGGGGYGGGREGGGGGYGGGDRY